MRRALIKFLFFMAFLNLGCQRTDKSWSYHKIENSNYRFIKLCHIAKEAHPSFTFELNRIQDDIAILINLPHFRFTKKNPLKVSAEVEGELFSDHVDVREGQMRVKLGKEMGENLIQALQEGKKVVILIDGFQQTLDPKDFASFFKEFIK